MTGDPGRSARLRQAGKAAVITLSALASLLAITGCGSPAYRIKEHPTPPVACPGYKAGNNGVELSVEALIVYESPGSWKQKAYWDEYVVAFTQHGPEAVTIDDVTLGDVLDCVVRPGDDPWALERAGRNHELMLRNLGAPAYVDLSSKKHTRIVAGVAAAGGLVFIYGGVGAAVAPALLFFGAPLMVITVGPVMAVNHFILDPKNKALVAAEFNRRRLPLPCELAPGATVRGSLFFPLTPGPERLTARIRSGKETSVLRVDLPGLEELHFTYVPDKEALKAARARYSFGTPGPRKAEPQDPP